MYGNIIRAWLPSPVDFFNNCQILVYVSGWPLEVWSFCFLIKIFNTKSCSDINKTLISSLSWFTHRGYEMSKNVDIIICHLLAGHNELWVLASYWHLLIFDISHQHSFGSSHGHFHINSIYYAKLINIQPECSIHNIHKMSNNVILGCSNQYSVYKSTVIHYFKLFLCLNDMSFSLIKWIDGK